MASFETASSESKTAKTDSEDEKGIADLFKEGLDLYNNLGRSDEPTNSFNVQSNVKKTIKIFENVTRLVSIAGVFSTNESIEEMPTSDLQYLLLPAFLGSLSLKLTTGERKDIVDVAEIYFKDFLKRCNDYKLSNYKFQDMEGSANESRDKTEFELLAQAVNTRSNKIQRFREQKELKTKLEQLKSSMDNEHADEELKRNYYMSMIKLFIYEAVDEINSIEMEKPILEHAARVKKDDKTEKRLPPAPLKPVIITRDAVQKAVYGAGYPGLPTMTVEEFYDKRVRDGIFPDPNKKKTGTLSLQEASLQGVPVNNEDREAEELENRIDNDDDENIARMRALDEHKDTHRRGWGNRHNRS